MDISRLLLLSAISLGSALAGTPAIPLTFEQRGSFFEARGVRIDAGNIELGGVRLQFVHSRGRLEAIGPAAPATYIGATSTRTFQQYSKLAIRNLYQGVDAVFYGNEQRLEYDLELAPGTSASAIRLSINGARIARDGSLVVTTADGEWRQLPPRVFQGDRLVACRYVLLGRNEVGFRLGFYDAGRALTIDPVVVYTKKFGGSAADFATAVATDSQGNVYVAGHSNSLDFPTTTSGGPTPPLVALTNSGKTITPLPIAGEISATAIGGSPDGAVLYVAAGGSVYYSSTGGSTWRKTAPIPAPIFSVLQQPLVVNEIAVDAADPSRAYLATSRGLYRTADNGGSWVASDYNLAATFDGSIRVASVAVSPVDHTILYAATTTPSYLYKSVDAGNRWQQLNPAYPGEPGPSPFFTNPYMFAVAPNGVDVYAVDSYGVLLKSTDSGATWQKIAEGFSDTRSIQFDRANPATIYVLTNAVRKSTDGGLTFTTLLGPTQFGVPVSAFAFDAASAAMYAAVSGTLEASTDQGATWQPLPLTVGFNVHTMKAIGGRAFVALDAPQTTFLVKLDPTGTRLLYSTFFNGKPLDNVVALQVDTRGNAYLLGSTNSQSIAGATSLTGTFAPGLGAGVVGKVTPDGTALAYLAVIGGSKGIFLQGLAIDAAGAAYVTGTTSSPDFATSPNAAQPKLPAGQCTRPHDSNFLFTTPNLGVSAVAAKIAPDGGSLLYSTFLTGTCGSRAQAVAVNAAGEAFVTGSTTSYDMPFPAGGYQAAFPGPTDKTSFPNAFNAGFAVRLSASGDKVLAGTYIGGGYTTTANGVTSDSAGNPVVTGSTWGIAPGATPGAYQSKITFSCGESPGIFGPPAPPTNGTDAFVLKLDPALAHANFLTYLGGSCFESGNAVALDPSGNVWVWGISSSNDFPLNMPFQGHSPNGGFISEFSADGSKLLFSSFTDAITMVVDPTGFVYLAAPPATLTKLDPIPTSTVVVNNILNVLLANSANAAAFSNVAVAPGQLVQVTGTNLGPAEKVDAQLDSSGRLPFTLAGTRVLFDGVAAPLISVQEGEIVCFVPFGVDGAKTTSVTVAAGDQTSNAVRLNVNASFPQIVAIANADGTPNSAGNPAARGSVITVYVSGLGQTSPASVDGKVTTAPAPVPIVPVTAFVAGVQAETPFVAAAMGLVAGITQVNVLVPRIDFPGATFVSINNSGASLFVKNPWD